MKADCSPFPLAALEVPKRDLWLLNRQCENHSSIPYSHHLNINLILKHPHIIRFGRKRLELANLDFLVSIPASQSQNKLEDCSPYSRSSTHGCWKMNMIQDPKSWWPHRPLCKPFRWFHQRHWWAILMMNGRQIALWGLRTGSWSRVVFVTAETTIFPSPPPLQVLWHGWQ